MLRDLDLPPPKDSESFERLCRELWSRMLGNPHTQLYGRRGQGQDGVDVLGTRRGTRDWVGIQCKVRTGGTLSKADVKEDVEKAKALNPCLAELVFATTARRDTKLQAFARELTNLHTKKGLFSVHVYFWEDLQELLVDERYRDVFRRFYEGLMLQVEPQGMAVARVMRVTIGVANVLDSTYDLLIGKMPPASEEGEDEQGLDHWNGTFLLADLGGRAIVTFHASPHYMRLAPVVRTTRDAFIIAKWLENPDSVDKLIRGDKPDHETWISESEYEEFVRSLGDRES